MEVYYVAAVQCHKSVCMFANCSVGCMSVEIRCLQTTFSWEFSDF